MKPISSVHLIGWVTAVIILFSSILMIFRVFIPKLSSKIMRAHCILNLLSMPFAFLHFILGVNNMWDISVTSLFTVMLLLFLQASGVILYYIKDAGKLRYYLRVLHFPLGLAFFFCLFFHVLDKLS